jgi:hypothetical protein
MKFTQFLYEANNETLDKLLLRAYSHVTELLKIADDINNGRVSDRDDPVNEGVLGNNDLKPEVMNVGKVLKSFRDELKQKQMKPGGKTRK